MRPVIHYQKHKETVGQILSFFPGLQPADLPDGESWAVERLELSTHAGTHMDAPWHFHSTTDDGARRAPTIDEAPLDLFMRPAVKLDFRHFADGYVATAADIDAELDRKSVVWGKSVSVRVDHGGRRIMKKKITSITHTQNMHYNTKITKKT